MYFETVKGTESSSEGSEKLTIAYTESVAEESVSGSSRSSSSSSFSSSLETPTSRESLSSQLSGLDRLREHYLHYGYPESEPRGPGLLALHYLRAHSVFQLFSFLLSHLLAHTPDQPVLFLVSLLDRCLRYRDADGEPPQLFTDSHVSSVYTALDPAGDGSITYRQYLVGMSTLGVTEFNLTPCEGESDNDSIPRDVFLSEAEAALRDQLDHLLGRPTNAARELEQHEPATEPATEPGTEAGRSDRIGKTYLVS